MMYNLNLVLNAPAKAVLISLGVLAVYFGGVWLVIRRRRPD